MQRGLAICARPSFSSMVSGRCEKVCPFVHFPGTLLFRRATNPDGPTAKGLSFCPLPILGSPPSYTFRLFIKGS
jgi:hypothetical protein